MEFCIRPLVPSDAEDIWRLRTKRGVFENILGKPTESFVLCQNRLNTVDPNSHQLAAVVKNPAGERVIGTVGLHIPQNARASHSASIGIMVDSDFQSLGVGTALMGAILDLADNWLILVRTELTVFTDNDKAIALYKKMGFELEGTKKMAAIRNGKYEDEFMMGRINKFFKAVKLSEGEG